MKLKGKQKKIDVAKPFGKITGEDFAKLREDKRSPFMGGGIAYAGGGRAMKREMYSTGSKSGRTKKKTEAQKQAAKTTGEKIMKVVKTIGKIAVPGAVGVDAGVRLAKRLNRKK